jgi:hypothetical protein
VSADERLNPHEFLGVVSTRLTHRLANYISAAAGNLAIHDSPNSTNEQKSAALAGFREATRRSGELLDRFHDLARSLRTNEDQASFSAALDGISNWVESHPGWKLETEPQILTLNPLAITGSSRWIEFALGAITQNAVGGKVIIQRCGPSPMPPHITQRSQAAALMVIETLGGEPIDWDDHRERLTSWTLAATYELLHHMGARPVSRSLPTGAHETRIALPLFSPEN